MFQKNMNGQLTIVVAMKAKAEGVPLFVQMSSHLNANGAKLYTAKMIESMEH